MQVWGPFAGKEGLEKSSSGGLVKELLIWLHRALMLQSPSHGNPKSMSGTSKKGTNGEEVGKEREERWSGLRNKRVAGGGDRKCLFISLTLSIKETEGLKM